MDVQGKVALVTGGGSGIGRATAQRLARAGAAVVVVDRDPAGARATATAIAAAGGKAVAAQADVADEISLAAAFARAEAEYGGLDIVVNNAGVMTAPTAFPETPVSAWMRTIEINLRGVILGTQLAIAALQKRGGGAIVNTASLAGVLSIYSDPVYAASKGGVILFTRSLAPLRLSHNIRVNCVCPGVVDTPLLHVFDEEDGGAASARTERVPKVQPEDIADGILALIANDDAAGEALQVAAGWPRAVIPAPTRDDLKALPRF